MRVNKYLSGTAIIFFLIVLASCSQKKEVHSVYVNLSALTDTAKQKADLQKILSFLPPDHVANGRLSFLDETFGDWLNRTGEIPPDFDNMPSIPFLPDPLIMYEGGKNIPVTTMDQ